MSDITLHEAIERILHHHNNEWMTPEAIADANRHMELYRKKDGGFPESSQIRWRINKPQYSPLFEFDRSRSPYRVRLRRR